ncbi:MAG: hypothetical protein M1142_02695 [Patescibacteria group bacterium]|nr:hypothetical protein [Patescibacteria group bacterium]
MSAEAPKQTGITAPQEPQGCLPGFLRRIFGITEPSKNPTLITSQPTFGQPPPGLENFADKINSVVDGRLAADQQKALDLENMKAAEAAAAAEAFAKSEKLRRQEAIKLQEEQQELIRKETDGILEVFRVAERLQYIKDTIWGGRGEIRRAAGRTFIAGKKACYTHQNYAYNWTHDMGGLELFYQYPSVRMQYVPKVEGRLNIGSGDYTPGHPETQRYEPAINSTALRITVVNVEQDSGNDRKELCISSVSVGYPGEHFLSGWTEQKQTNLEFYSASIPREAADSETLLETALYNETVRRVEHGSSPAALEERARKELDQAKKSPKWQKWVAVPDGQPSCWEYPPTSN